SQMDSIDAGTAAEIDEPRLSREAPLERAQHGVAHALDERVVAARAVIVRRHAVEGGLGLEQRVTAGFAAWWRDAHVAAPATKAIRRPSSAPSSDCRYAGSFSMSRAQRCARSWPRGIFTSSCSRLRMAR